MQSKKSKSKTDKILVIVESPAKAKTINKYLGKNYIVTASMGHIIDLPKSRMGIDVENGFKPEYITVRGKGKILNELKKYASKSKEALLASDNDREGEAIAYHIGEAIGKKYPDLPIRRIVFNEITKNAILDSIKEPREIDINKIKAQKTRRTLDRLVGYNISPILWEKVKRGLSAGRVQSVTLRVICEREEEIESFIPKEYWTLEAEFVKNKKEIKAELFKVDGEKIEFRNKNEVDKLLEKIDTSSFVVSNIQTTPKTIKPSPPFITSKLQQTAANRFNFTSKKTMSVAQQLYEGIDLGSERIGLITYMRTDSTRISNQAIDETRKYIAENYNDSLPDNAQFYSKSDKAQDAHEAIRPTSVYRTPEYVKKYLTPDQFKIYSIIWERLVASQMTGAVYENTVFFITSGNVDFKISNSATLKEGFNLCLNLLKSKETEKTVKVKFELGEKVSFKQYLPEQHFTQAPPRYTDATIIKFLEENGIGRPSTYAPTISTLQDRYYVVRKSKQLIPTILGKLINKIITTSFPNIVDVDFTAKMEKDLDDVENGVTSDIKLLSDFYSPFIEKVEIAQKSLESHKKSFEEETGELCDKCGKPMVKKLGKYGFFLACSGFPECRNSKPIPLADCPRENCGGKIVGRKKAARGKEFYGCTNYPDCDFVTWTKPTEYSCPKCGKFLIEKNDKIHGTYKLCIDEKCGYKQIEEH